MRKSLGSFLLLTILLTFSLEASTYKWSSFVNKKKAYVGESIYLKYLCEFDDNGELYIIDFNPRGNDLYEIVLLSKDEKIKNGKRINTYEYIVQIKSAQDLSFVFQATMKETLLDSIVNNTTSHYDDTKFDSIHKTTIVKMDKIAVDILDTPKELLGDLTLSVSKDEKKVKAYEPYHLDITYTGAGNFDAIKKFTFDLENVKIFTQEPIKNITVNQNGYEGSWTQKFAFVSDKDFSIPAKSVEYFNTLSGKIEVLKMDAIDVKVEAAYKKTALLDEVEEVYSFDAQYLYYAISLVAGFLVGKIKFRPKSINTENEELIGKIKETKSFDELSILLILRDEKKFTSILEGIDSNIFTSLIQAKKMTIKLVS